MLTLALFLLQLVGGNGFVLAAPSVRYATTFGDLPSGGYQYAQRFYAPAGAGTVELREIGCWGYATAAGRKLKLAVWTDDEVNSCPGDIVSGTETAEIPWPTSVQRVFYEYPARPALEAGRTYWLGLITSAPVYLDRAEFGGDTRAQTGTWPTFKTGDAWHTIVASTRDTSLYAVYVPASPSTPPPAPALRATVVSRVKLAWDANTETDLAGYKVYWGTAPGTYGQPVTVPGTPAFPTYTVPELAPGTYYFAVTAYNLAGLESGYSNEVSATIGAEPPPPTNAITWLGVSDITASSAAIAWTTAQECSGSVEWGTTNALGTRVVANNLGTTDHWVRLIGLPARSHLYYRVTSGCANSTTLDVYQSPIRTFNTK